MNYREISSGDTQALFEVRTATIENSFTLEELHSVGITESSVERMLATTHVGWLCQLQDEVVGFCIGDKTTGEMWVLAVRPEHERKGIGSHLLRLLETTLAIAGYRELWLITSPDRSLRAHGFYRSQGWSEENEVDGELRMIKLIHSSPSL